MSEYIISKEQVAEINRAHGGMQIITSWLSCYAIWDTSAFPPRIKHEDIAITLPEIVRCRDCRFARPEPKSDAKSRKPFQGGYWCDELSEGIGLFCDPDCFCSWGERREL